MIDPAMCRPGRLDKLLYVDLPNADERAEIMRTMLRGVPLATAPIDGDLTTEDAVQSLVQSRCEGYSGADLAALVREAGVLALRETLRMLDFSFSSSSLVDAQERADLDQAEKDITVEVTLRHFENALDKVVPSVSAVQRRKYEALRSKFAGLPVRGGRKEKAIEGEGDGLGSGNASSLS